MVMEETKSTIRIGADGKLKGAGAFEPGTLVKSQELGGGRVRETYVSSVQMSPKDIPILQEVQKKYGDMSKPEAQKEFFRRANLWRKKMNQRLNKPEPEPEKKLFPAVILARRFQLALCRIANGSFSQLNERDLQDCAILGSLQQEQRTFEAFKQFVEALESGE